MIKLLIATILSITVNVQASPSAVPRQLLKEARTEYAKKSFSNAIRIYKSIPRNSKEFLESREELAWSYLQAGDWSSLQGILPHLNSPLIPIEYRLEGRVLDSISALHTCDFSQIKKDLSDFQTEIRPYALSLDKQLQSKSVNKTSLLNQRSLVLEAITKMRFVKTELLSQLLRLERYKTKHDVLTKTSQVSSNDDQFSDASLQTAEKTKLVFTAGDDMWPDELFNLKSLSTSECDQFSKARL